MASRRLDCPCCVADILGVTCQGGGETGTTSDESIVEQAEEFYWEGGTLLCAGLGGLIGLGLITALCCCRDIRKTVSGCGWLFFRKYA